MPKGIKTVTNESQIDTTKRPKRIPLRKQTALNMEGVIPEGMVPYWVNEERGRVEAFLRAGWIPVPGNDDDTTDNRAQSASQLGSVIRKVVNKDSKAPSHTAILMMIPKELYDIDEAEKQKENDRIEESYNPNNVRNATGMDYGSIRIDKHKK